MAACVAPLSHPPHAQRLGIVCHGVLGASAAPLLLELAPLARLRKLEFADWAGPEASHELAVALAELCRHCGSLQQLRLVVRGTLRTGWDEEKACAWEECEERLDTARGLERGRAVVELDLPGCDFT